jgi:hypothetical protein
MYSVIGLFAVAELIEAPLPVYVQRWSNVSDPKLKNAACAPPANIASAAEAIT